MVVIVGERIQVLYSEYSSCFLSPPMRSASIIIVDGPELPFFRRLLSEFPNVDSDDDGHILKITSNIGELLKRVYDSTSSIDDSVVYSFVDW